MATKRLEELARRVKDRLASEAMTPLERFKTLNRFQEADRIAVILQVNEQTARLAKVPVKKICTDPETFVEAQLLALLEYGHDIPCGFADCYNIEVEALGTPLVYVEDRFPEIARRIIDQPADLDRLQMPDFMHSGRMGYVMDVGRLLGELVGDVMSLYAAVTAPFSIAVNLRGYERMMVDIVEDPDFVHRLMEFSTRVSMGFAKAQMHAGAMATSIIDAWAAPPLVSLSIFDEFVLPYTARVCGALTPPGASWGGIWGYSFVPDWRALARRVIAAGTTNVRVFGADLDRSPDIRLDEFKTLLTQHHKPMLCGVTAKLLTRGTTDEIERRVKELVKLGAPGGAFTIYGEMVPVETPLENVKFFVECAKRLGRYPIRVD